jgi:drug/metabolite transporter (DMT)-like permease
MNRFIGVVLVAISAASFGTVTIFCRYAYADGIDTSTLLFLRFTLAALLMAGLLLFRGESLPRGKTLVWLVGIGAIGYAGQSFVFLTSIKYASVGLVAILLYLYPTFVTILSAIFLKEKITGVKLAILGLATLGAALTANPQGGQGKGILLALSAAAMYAIYIMVIAGVMRKVSAIQSSTVIFASVGIVYGLVTALNGPHWPATRSGWIAVGGMALIGTVVSVTTFLAGIRRIGPADASMVSTLEPIVTVLLAAMLFAERLSPVTLLGGGLILASVLLLTRTELQRARPHESKKCSLTKGVNQ